MLFLGNCHKIKEIGYSDYKQKAFQTGPGIILMSQCHNMNNQIISTMRISRRQSNGDYLHLGPKSIGEIF